MLLPDHSDKVNALGEELGLMRAEVLRQTDKSLTISGSIGDRPVVTKLLLDDDRFWTDKLNCEIDTYRIFECCPPPICVPRLVHAEKSRLLVLERLAGQPLNTERYPRSVLPNATVDATLNAVIALNRWQPPEGVFTPVFDYVERIDRYRAHGIISDEDACILHSLVNNWTRTWEVNHGDPIPSNVLLTENDGAALLDWEFSGLYLPGFDLALLKTLLTNVPYAQRRIEHIVTQGDIVVPFMINLAAVLTREIRTHRELPRGPLRDQRIPLIETLWSRCRERLRTLASGKP